MQLHPDIERLARLGWRLYPSSRSRKGMFKGYIDDATSDRATLIQWGEQYPGCNWSVIPQGSGIWALDLDTPSPDHAADGVAALRELCGQHGCLPPSPHGRSGGGGDLLVFRDAGHPIRTKTGTPAPGIDPRAGRTPFTVAPSIHRRGGHYSWLVAPWDLDPPIAPDWLLKQVAPSPRPSKGLRGTTIRIGRVGRCMVRAVERVRDARPGARNATLNREAFLLGRLVSSGRIDRDAPLVSLYRAGRSCGLDDGECRATIRSGFEAGLRQPWGA
jgi:Bifunctional DNA primase/polymerase, N-terminal